MVLSLNCFSQNRNSVWCFGDSAGIDFSNVNNPTSLVSAMRGRGACVSICDTLGSILFYGNTYSGMAETLLWNSQHDTLDNSDTLIGEGYYNELQIVPFPNNSNKYYLFQTGIAGFFDGVYYSVIDMTLDGGLGSVILKNQQIFNNRVADCIQAIRHGNGRDWWVITKVSSTNLSQLNRFIVFQVTPNGVSNPVSYDFGFATDQDFQKIIFNCEGSKIMNINTTGYMCEFDFDRCNGVISNPHVIYPELSAGPFNRIFWEGSYSPNDSLFYIATSRYFGVNYGYLLQYDLTSNLISNSCDTLDSAMVTIGAGSVRLAPDGKIYYSRAYENPLINSFPYADTMYNYINMNLSVINDPNNLGAACNFQPFSFYLGGKRTYYGLPNNPNYDLGPLIGSVCDTLTTVSSFIPIKEAEMYVYYHPSWQTLFVNAQNIKDKNCLLQIFDINGRCVFAFHDKAVNGYFTHDVPLPTTANGIYLLKLTTEKETLTTKFVKQ